MDKYLYSFWATVALASKALLGFVGLFFVVSLFGDGTSVGFGIIFLLFGGVPAVMILFEAIQRCQAYQNQPYDAPSKPSFKTQRRLYAMPKTRRH